MHFTDPFRQESAFPPPVVPIPDPEALVVGTSAEILAWVGDSATRAKTVLDAEMASSDPRKTLVAKLEKLIV